MIALFTTGPKSFWEKCRLPRKWNTTKTIINYWPPKGRFYASINSSGAHPPPSPPGQPRGICLRCQSRGLGISISRGDPRAFGTRVFEREISLSGRTRPLSKTGLSVKEEVFGSFFPRPGDHLLVRFVRTTRMRRSLTLLVRLGFGFSIFSK